MEHNNNNCAHVTVVALDGEEWHACIILCKSIPVDITHKWYQVLQTSAVINSWILCMRKW